MGFFLNWVRIRHIPSGITVMAREGRSMMRMRASCVAMLKGKLWSLQHGGYMAVKDRIVRSYTDADFDRRDIVDMPQRRWGQE